MAKATQQWTTLACLVKIGLCWWYCLASLLACLCSFCLFRFLSLFVCASYHSPFSGRFSLRNPFFLGLLTCVFHIRHAILQPASSNFEHNIENTV